MFVCAFPAMRFSIAVSEVWCRFASLPATQVSFSSRRAHDNDALNTLQGHSHSQLPHPDPVVSINTVHSSKKDWTKARPVGGWARGITRRWTSPLVPRSRPNRQCEFGRSGGALHTTTHHHAPPRTTSHHYALLSHCEKHSPMSQELHLWSLQSHLNPPFPPFFAPTNNAPFPLASSAFSTALQLVSRRPGTAKPGVRSSTWFRGSGSSFRASQIPPSLVERDPPPLAFCLR
ncbi:hypothetical protein EDB80DRAFT_331948 [Ilyonectria destructans]|nr:hypothetical protein EDB80DRAFT_331948 [Ilyonectria destructans]